MSYFIVVTVALARIPKSKHLLQILDFFEDREGVCVVVNYCSGGTLGDLASKGPVHGDRVLRFVLQIARGLRVLHTNMIIHRDIKPDNIFFETSDGPLQIGDFGLVSSPFFVCGLSSCARFAVTR